MNAKVITRKKLIEVALPLEAINIASAKEKSIRQGNPSTMHLWWARRPLAAARAVIFSQLVDDPSAVPEEFPTKEDQHIERERLFRIIEKLVLWDNTANKVVIKESQEEIWRSWQRACADNKDHPKAKELFNPEKLPAFHDPFAGGGALPLEAQRLGLESYASDLNPVAVLINKAMIEIPPKFAGQPPVNPEARRKKMDLAGSWRGANGLAEDVRYYGQWVRDEAEKRIGHLYPKVEITTEMVRERPDLQPLQGKKLTVIAWIWARTIKSPNPAFTGVEVPLATTFMLSSKSGNESYIKPVIDGKEYRFVVKTGKPESLEAVKNGTKLGRGANFRCLMSGVPISGDYIKAEGKAGRMSARLMAIIAEGNRGSVYISPTTEMENIVHQANPLWKPEQELVGKSADQVPLYGMKQYWQLFTPRQLVSLTTISDLILDARDKLRQDALASGMPDEETRLDDGGTGAASYADAVAVYLGLGIGRSANYWSSLTPWGGGFIVQTFGRQAIAMVWDYAEANPFSNSTGNWTNALLWIQKVITNSLPASITGTASLKEAQNQTTSLNKFISTDPPYYDNICYADLSDFFYVWLRHSMKTIYPSLFATMVVPKTDELIASTYRHGSKKEAEKFFLEGMKQAMQRLAEQAHPSIPITIYYAFKQAESVGDSGVASTGWETFLEAIIKARLCIYGTWPIRTERDQGLKTGANVLASSIIIVCRRHIADAPTITRRDFLAVLKIELPIALVNLQRSNIAPVDLAQAIIGPGMAIYTRYSKIIDTEGNELNVRGALALINQTLDEVLAEQEGDFDADTRWALVWFEQYGFNEAEYGVAETLSKSKNTSVTGMENAGIVESGHGIVRLFKPSELPDDWDPTTDKRLTVWEIVHHLIRALDTGEGAAAELLVKLGTKAEPARELAYRLFTICERKKRATDAIAYNSLVQSWPGVSLLAADRVKFQPRQPGLL